MRALLKLSAIAIGATLVTGCASTRPLEVTSNNGPTKKVGEASCMSIFVISRLGDCGYETAKKNGNITNVHHADEETLDFYVFAKHKTKVYGE